MKRLVFLFLFMPLAVSTLTLSANGQKAYKIALSNSFYGNTWRKQMVDVMQKAADAAKGQGLISDFAVDNGDGTANTQLAQLNSLILSHPDAILINAASPTALNGAVAQAVQQGIKVIIFDSLTTGTDAYQISYDVSSWGEIAAKYVVKRLGSKGGNVLITRGVVGSQPELLIYNAVKEVLKDHPEIHVLGEVDTEADNAKAQSAVANLLPSMPNIDAVLTEGSYGVVQAFLAAGKPVPLVIGNNRAEFIRWWADEKAKNGYETISLGSEPSIGAIAFWLSIHILRGEKVPEMKEHPYLLPLVAVTNDTLDQFKDIQPGTVIAQAYDDQWVKDHILNKQ
ncbi:MAG: ABC transporter substrate-binding protein [Verrucomicrobia bacterium]|nr:ABC transporter substrate-binding protein [Verrucomicrobiota bacterium]